MLEKNLFLDPAIFYQQTRFRFQDRKFMFKGLSSGVGRFLSHD